MTKKTEIAIAVPVHNGGQYLRRALDCLRAQTFTGFKVLVLDDGSTDGSDAVIREYVAKDRRLHHVRLKKRVGMIEAWRRSARLSAKMFCPEFFAWYSDHDWVAPDWLEHLHAAIARSARTALVHAHTLLMDIEGRDTGTQMEWLDTSGLATLQRLEKATFSNMGAGDAVYGLFRWSVLNACGVFRDEILPDRLLVAEVNLHGDIAHVAKAVRFRRQTRAFTGKFELVERQLKTLFPDGYTKKNPYISHATFFLRLAQERALTRNLRADFARHYLGFIYYQRSLRKFREPLLKELGEMATPATNFFAELVEHNLAAPTLMPVAAHEAASDKKKKAFENRAIQFGEKVRSLSEELEAATHAQSQSVSELAGTRASLETARAEARSLAGKLQATALAQSEAEAKLAVERTALDGARAEICVLSERLQATSLARSEIEGELARVRAQLTDSQEAKATLDCAGGRIQAPESYKGPVSSHK